MQPHGTWHRNQVYLPDPGDLRKLCQPPTVDLCGVCAELDSMNVKIAQAKAALEDLLDQRDNLRSQLNRAHPSTFDHFPVEIASKIFALYSASVDKNDDSPLTLGAICQRWREIAWSTPSVWTALDISFGKGSLVKLQNRVDVVTEWLGRSGMLPLSIRLQISLVDESDYVKSQIYRLFSVINQYRDYWYSLALRVPFDLLQHFHGSMSVSTTRTLHELTILSIGYKNYTIHVLSGFSPRIVHMRGLVLGSINLNWTQVTQLTFDLLSVVQVFHIFQSSPNLRTCHFELVQSQASNYLKHTAHPNIESLDITFSNRQSDRLFFNTVTLPGLKSLRVRRQYIYLDPDHLIPFLTRSSSGLRFLSIDDTGYASEDLIHVGRSTPLLEELVITHNVALQGYLDKFYDALRGLPPGHGTLIPASTDPLLPLLRTFHWRGHGSFPWRVIPPLLAPFSKIDTGRRRPMERINVCCDRYSGTKIPIPYIDDSVLSQLRSFQDTVKFSFTIQLDTGWKDLLELSLNKISEENSGVV